MDATIKGYFYGLINPVSVAQQYISRVGAPMDEASFDRVASAVGDIEAEGFLVETLADVQKLCELGNFVVVVDQDCVIRAYLPGEWPE